MRAHKRRRIASPFLVTVATAAITLVPACSGEVITGGASASCPDVAPSAGDACSAALSCSWDDGADCTLLGDCLLRSGRWSISRRGAGCDPRPSECPAAQPGQSTPCFEIGAECSYPIGDPCNGQLVATCDEEGKWDITAISPPCNPPPCPVDLPGFGAACDFPQTCSYVVDQGCGPEPFDATCDGATWTIMGGGPCNPPAPDLCPTYFTWNECDIAGCRWLVPGCGMNPLAKPACFNHIDCTDDSQCYPGQTCIGANIDPCLAMGCAECSADVMLCAP